MRCFGVCVPARLCVFWLTTARVALVRFRFCGARAVYDVCVSMQAANSVRHALEQFVERAGASDAAAPGAPQRVSLSTRVCA